MANRLTIRFYEISKLLPHGPSLEVALQTIKEHEHAEREVQLGEGVSVRLERLDNDAGELAGEFTRVRRDNFPYRVMPDGVEQLDVDGPLGNGVAFRYRPHDRLLAIQYNNLLVSPGRVVDYLLQFNNRFAYDFTPKMNEQNWRKFNDNPVRKLNVAIASPQNLAAVEDEFATVRSAVSSLSEAYQSPVVKIEMSMGHNKGALRNNIRDLASAIYQKIAGGEADVRSLKATISSEDGEPSEEINLIDEFLSEKVQFPNPVNDPEANYEIRRGLLLNAMINYA